MFDFILFLFNFVEGLLTFNDSNVICCVMGVDDALMASAAIGAGANLLGGLFGSKNQSSANKTNLKIARETNALNYKMFQEQQQYNTNMWNMNNTYNSPTSQVQRARSAGLNPYFNIGDLVSASNSSAPSSPSLPSLVTPHVEAYDPSPSFNAVGNIIGNLLMQQAQVNNLNQQTQSSKDLTYAQVKHYIAQDEELKHSARFKALSANLLNDTYNYEKQSKMYNANIMREQWLQSMVQTKVANIQAKMAELHLEKYPQELENSITQQLANIMLTQAQTHKSYKDAALAAAQAVESTVRAEGYRISNDQAYHLVPYVVDKAAYDSYKNRQEYQVYRHFGTYDIGRKTHKTFHGSLGLSKHFGGMAEWNENYDDWMSLPEDWFGK